LNILGLNAFHADAAACLIVDGRLIAAAEEERFRRVKHWAGLPTESIRYCLEAGRISIDKIDRIAVNRNPGVNLWRKILYSLRYRPSLEAVIDRVKNSHTVHNLRAEIAAALKISPCSITAQITGIEHHLAHLSSAFFVSPFEDAAVASVDGFGDFASAMWGVGRGQRIEIVDCIYFPHSLGLFYSALTQYLGFPNYGDEYKVMGLAPYGETTETEKLRRVITLLPNGRFRLNLEYFSHHSKGVEMQWAGGEPTIGKIYSPLLEELLGPRRSKEQPISSTHRNIAASAQAIYEEVFFHFLNHVQTATGMTAVALAGGCAMNSVANGRIFQQTKFKDLYVQASAGDAGGAIGSAFAVWHHKLRMPRNFKMDHAYWGPEFSTTEISELLSMRSEDLEHQNCSVRYFDNFSELCRKTAIEISEGKVVGWFQGRMEWGPRALGNRSILGDPRRADMKDILNLKIKRRESFRPFAPSVLREDVKDWFETDYGVPFMLQVFQVLESRRSEIPAVTHVNGSGRLQTVTEIQNSRYYTLIKIFGEMTGVPILLNTSFNENEPVVCSPEEALNCFLRTKMDLLVLGDFVVQRRLF